MLAQAARWKAKNSPLRREPGNQRAELLQALRDKPTRCFFFCGMKCQGNVEQLWQRGRDGREGERQPSAPRFLEPATVCVSSPEGFFQGNREVIQALPHGSSAWATRSNLYNHRGGVRCLCPARRNRARPKPRAAGQPGKAKAGSRGSTASPEPPRTLPRWSGAQACHEGLTCLRTLRIYLVLDPACPATS